MKQQQNRNPLFWNPYIRIPPNPSPHIHTDIYIYISWENIEKKKEEKLDGERERKGGKKEMGSGREITDGEGAANGSEQGRVGSAVTF